MRAANQGRATEQVKTRRNPENLAVVGVSNMNLMVGAEGLEPPTYAL